MPHLTWFSKVEYIQCTCGLPGCCIRVAADEDDEDVVWFSMQTHPGSFWMRLKAAWRVLWGGKVEWCEVALNRPDYMKIVNMLVDYRELQSRKALKEISKLS